MAFFGGFLDAPRACPLIATPIFLEMKGVEVVRIWAKFHLHLTCGSGVFSLQMFSYLRKAGVNPFLFSG